MNTESEKVVVRYAPSPTGLMHIGTLRTMLYDYLFAKHNDGKVILRVEDTDKSREVEGSYENLERLIEWAGIPYDEGPIFQSDRAKEGVYRKYVDILLENGDAYHCFCTKERLDEMRKKQQAQKIPPMYDRKCLSLSKEEVSQRIKDGEKYVIRFLVPKGKDIEIKDAVRGKIVINTDTVDDQVLMKSDGFPTYHLANVVDDHEMGVTHVFRGEEWVTSTPKHILLYNAFKWKAPKFAHLPLLLNADGKKKLSKRQGDVAVEDFIQKGYLRDALINFIALLGWNPGGGDTKEIFSMEELIEKFDLKKVHKAGAAVDIKRLNWMNSQYIKKMDTQEFITQAMPHFKSNFPDLKDEEVIKKILVIEKDRMEVYNQAGKENTFLFNSISLDKELLIWKDASLTDTKKQLERALQVLGKIDETNWEREFLNKLLLSEAGDNKGEFLWPLRAALTGQKYSPSPMDCAWVLGKKESLNRIKKAIELC